MRVTIDGNEAVASVAHRLSEVCCIYPITPSSPMAELADEWSTRGRTNLWGSGPRGRRDAERGRRRGRPSRSAPGRCARNDLHCLAGPAADDPQHVQDRRRADARCPARGRAGRGDAGALDLRRSLRRDGGPPDRLRAARLRLGAGGPRPGSDRTCRRRWPARVPFLHFFDGFRTSHELNTIELLDDEDLRAVVPDELVREHRARALSPERPFIRGTAQNPDTFFQARETVNPFYARVPETVQGMMNRLRSADRQALRAGRVRRPP